VVNGLVTYVKTIPNSAQPVHEGFPLIQILGTWFQAFDCFLAILGHFLQDFSGAVVKTETAFVFSDGSLVAHSAIVLVAGRDLNVLF
jgi:hypothetical protein